MMKNRVEKNIEISKLFDCYKNLLTDKQVEYFELYFAEDLSFQEIADEKSISKTAVHDAINKIINILKDLESKLKLSEKKEKINLLLNQYESDNSKINEILQKIKEIN
ncbi:DNA-binding protein [Mesoplasma corruscae]|uniref:UPF0122 protein MCORR_v1c00630 n=2 Tax=Mesoplasma corruscae TaxID=216874 RepID=A0A2S5RH32_9MOLU|nr:DNA-binding protein [Mesoplasma corruscae]